MTASERPETYLRLMAEAELRRALVYPRHKPAEPSGLPPAVSSAVRLSSPLLAPLLPPVRSAARVSGPLLASLWPAARTAVSAARQTAVGRAAEPVLWRTLRARRAVRPPPGLGRSAEPPAEAGLDGVRRVASALVMAGTISDATARAVLDDLSDALAVRGKLTMTPLYWPLRSGPGGPGSPGRPGSPPPALPAAAVQAVPIGTTVPLGPGGDLGEAALLALVLAPDRAVLTAATRLSQAGPSPRRPRRTLPPPPLGQLTAVDEHGTRYQAGHSARAFYERWLLAFDLSPVPPPGIRWLDLSGPDITDPIRVDLTLPADGGDSPGPEPAGPAPAGLGPAGPEQVSPDRGAEAGLPAGVSPAERPLDALAENLLAEAAHGYRTRGEALDGLTEVVGALQAAAGLTADSAALGRLATLADRLGIRFPPSLRFPAQPGLLPDAWQSVLEHRGATDGPDRVAAVAAVLPDVDGARFAVAGLDSMADSATLRVMAWGWQPGPLIDLGERFSWWARDDGGRWHLARERGAHYGGGQVDLLVEFGPALHPDARSLELIVRGPASRGAMTLPLRWLESR
jgi:hypothetical protein